MERWERDYKLGQLQVAIETGVKKHCISMREWNLRTERVEKVLGDLLWWRDHLLAEYDDATVAWRVNRIAQQGLCH